MIRVLTAAAALATALVVSHSAAAPIASAAPHDIIDDGAPGYLVVEVDPGTFDVELDPGESDEWIVTVRSDAPTPGHLDFSLESSGDLAAAATGAIVSIDECSISWAGPRGSRTCPGTRTSHVGPSPFAVIEPTAARSLGTIAPQAAVHLKVVVSLPDAMPSELQGTAADFQLTFRGVGADVTVGTGAPDDMPSTGARVAAPLFIAGAAIAAGMILTLLVRVARREEATA